MENPNTLLSKIEAARLWAYFHKDWLLSIRVMLRPQLPPHYFVFVESETLLVTPDAEEPSSAILPDLSVARAERPADDAGWRQLSGATAAVLELDEPCEVFCKYMLLIRRAPENQVVAALELLSPSNKGLGNRWDREKHVRKRNAFLEAGVSLLEIDALTEGERVLPTSVKYLARFQRNAWSAFHHAGRRSWRGWGWSEADPLPVISWTIEEDLAVLVDLAEAMEHACDFNRWEDLV
jgi:hypothetical protein